MTDYVVEADVLEAYLLHSLLEVGIVQDFECITVNEKHSVAFDLCVARLHQTFISWLFSSLVAIKPKVLDPFHFILPLLWYDFKQSFGWYIIRGPSPSDATATSNLLLLL